MTIRERLLQARRAAGFPSAAAAARNFGWPAGTYCGHENGHRGLREPALRRYARAYGVDPVWLLTGEGVPALRARPVPVVELDAAAGGGASVAEERRTGEVWFHRDWLDRRGIDPTRCVVIGVRGESMEPTLPHGCSILVDRGRVRRRDGRIYAVRTDDGLVVKRAGRDGAGRWLLASDNPAFAPVPWPRDSETLGEVRWTARSL